EGVPADHFEELERGPVVKLQPERPVQEGQERQVKLVEVGLHDPTVGVAKDGDYPIAVADAADMVGKRVKVRIERVLDDAAYAELVGGRAKQALAPITAEAQAEKPTRARRSRAAKPKAEQAVAKEPVAEEPVAEEPIAEEAVAEGAGAQEAGGAGARGPGAGRGRRGGDSARRRGAEEEKDPPRLAGRSEAQEEAGGRGRGERGRSARGDAGPDPRARSHSGLSGATGGRERRATEAQEDAARQPGRPSAKKARCGANRQRRRRLGGADQWRPCRLCRLGRLRGRLGGGGPGGAG